MGRPKGSKNKPREAAVPVQLKEKGNPLFNLKDAEPVDIASAAVLEEDLALDRELEIMARNSAPPISDEGPAVEMKKSSEPYTLLSEFEDDYKPAETIHELDDQVWRAKQVEADSIEASEKIIRYFTKGAYPEKIGYFVYHDIKVYIPGFFQQSRERDQETIEQRVFGKSR